MALVSTRWDGTDLQEHLRVTWRIPILVGGREVSRTSDVLMPTDYSTRDEAKEPIIPQASADMVMMAPKGDQALAQINNDVYVITVPMIGGKVPTVLVTKPDSAQMPVRKLTDIGGEFATWGRDGRTVYWSLGNALATYRLDRAQAMEDSLRRAGRHRHGGAPACTATMRRNSGSGCRRHGTFPGARWCCGGAG